jgi:hypothetical protein
VAHLPGAVHLVAQAPELDAKRLAGTIRDTHVAEFAAAGVILKAAGGVLEFEPKDAEGIKGSIVAWNGRLPLHESLNMD